MWLIPIIAAVLAAAGIEYAFLPALNLRSAEMWMLLLLVNAGGAVLAALVGGAQLIMIKRADNQWEVKGVKPGARKAVRVEMMVFGGAAVVSLLALVLGAVAGLPIFHAKDYAGLIDKVTTVQEKNIEDFRAEFAKTDSVTNVALMDSTTAAVVGARQLGKLSEYVSQYTTGEQYTTITLNGGPMKVTELAYAGLFQWLNSRKTGIPGYISVNPVDQSAAYVKLEQGMTYTRSAYLNQNLLRYARLHYPTKIFGGNYGWLEINEQGDPWYILPTYQPTIGLFSGRIVTGAVMVNPVTGDHVWAAVEELPEWVDRVYDGDYLINLYNNYGYYRNGYWNFSNAGRVQTTDDYGFLTIGNDIWVYTGVTSVVTSGGDESNIGFVLMNQRTAETVYYSIPGAEEHTAMYAAQGQVANYGYIASFPSLVNIAGEPTYVMVLRDSSFVVKGYALVNMSQYNLVGVGTNQATAIANYKAALGGEASGSFGMGGAAQPEQSQPEQTPAQPVVTQPAYTVEGDTEAVTVEVAAVQFATVGGNTYAYLKGTDGQLYRVAVDGSEEILFAAAGDTVALMAEAAPAAVKDAKLN